MAVASNKEGRELVPTGGLYPERKQWPAHIDGAKENEGNPPFPEHCEIGEVLGVRLPGGQDLGELRVCGFPGPSTSKAVVAGAHIP